MATDLKNIKGIIFDYGGTLDTGGDHWSEVIWKAWQKAGVAANKAQFRECYVYAERELARTLHILPHHNFSDLLYMKMQIELQHLCEMGGFAVGDIDPMAEKIANLCLESAKDAIEKIKPTLDKLAQTYPLVLVSNFYGNIITVLQQFGISKYFKKVIESAVVGVRKPDPKIFELGVEALGLPAAEVLVIGDSFTKDIDAAQKAGCKAVWLKGKQWSEEEQKRFYPFTISNLDEILNLLEGE